MEKTLTPDEKIRRAEELYYRKKVQNANKKSARVNVSNKKDFGMFKRMSLRIIICILIYAIFYMIQNTNYIFSEDVINKVNNILSYDINIKNLYEQYSNYIRNVGAAINSPQEEYIEQNSTVENETNENKTIENLEIQNTNSIQEENIGGENIELVEEIEKKEETLSQIEQDAIDIIKTKSLIIPLKGTITSRFGEREPKTATVPKNHTGIDIAVNEGTVFIAAMSGVVQQVSNKRGFRKSF